MPVAMSKICRRHLAPEKVCGGSGGSEAGAKAAPGGKSGEQRDAVKYKRRAVGYEREPEKLRARDFKRLRLRVGRGDCRYTRRREQYEYQNAYPLRGVVVGGDFLAQGRVGAARARPRTVDYAELRYENLLRREGSEQGADYLIVVPERPENRLERAFSALAPAPSSGFDSTFAISAA